METINLVIKYKEKYICMMNKNEIDFIHVPHKFLVFFCSSNDVEISPFGNFSIKGIGTSFIFVSLIYSFV